MKRFVTPLRSVIRPGSVSVFAAAALLSVAGPVSAALEPLTLFSGMSTGAELHGTGGWSVLPAGTNLLVVPDPASAQGKVLEITSSGSYRTARRSASVAVNATATVYFRLRLPAAANADVSFGLTELVSPATETPATTLRVNNATLQAHDGTFKDLVTIQPEVWYECWMVVDNPADRYELFLRGPGDEAPVQLADGNGNTRFAFRSGTGSQELRTFQIRANNAHAGKTLHLGDIWLDATNRTVDAPESTLVVDAGPSIQVTWGPGGASADLAATLGGTAPDIESATILWTKVSGPGSVIFDSADQASTGATFSGPGDYELKVQATLPGGQSASAIVEVTVTAAGSYTAYKTSHFGPDILRVAAPWADANGDGISNLLHHAFGTDPLGSSSPVSPLVSTVDPLSPPVAGASRGLVIRYPKDQYAGVDVVPEWTADLASGAWTSDGVIVTPPAEPDGLHTATLPLADGDRAAFMRLRASLQGGRPNPKGDGYRGIWFKLGQTSTYGDKYSGGLGTYTSSHSPLAIYSPEANKTFFTYGGTPEADQRALQIMVGYYDHATGLVSRPTLVYAAPGVDDPHDNASLALDEEGHVWLFVSGRNTTRLGRAFRSELPFSIERFEQVREAEFTYPQPYWFEGRGFLHLFTKYTNGRELYWSTSRNGDVWSPDQKLAGIGGHYQVSDRHGDRIGTAFNRHPGGSVDARTDLYYLQTDDFGATWKTAAGVTVATPVSSSSSQARVRNYSADGRLVYVQDMAFDLEGRPAILYVTSSDYRPGPNGSPRLWEIAHWQGSEWVFREVTTSTHNYDVGFLRIESDGTWRIFGPTEEGPQGWGAGGEVALWESTDGGATWTKIRDLTGGSEYNHGYVRHPVNAHPDFYAFWADGDADKISASHLYFSNEAGDRVFKLPYTMTGDFAEPEEVTPPAPQE